VHIGDVHVHLAPHLPIGSRYHQQVRRIAPPELIGRESELAELAAFSADPASTYRWWRAEAWSGKSALMSWFVLHPPENVRVVSFFVTARWAEHADRVAFIDNVLEQLATLMDQDLPRFLTEATKEAYVLGLLEEADTACRDRGEHLVLLVDGLDEDRGVTAGPNAHSIAALLPVRIPPGLRIIVAGRPNPPVPSDVPEDHPLRSPAVVRPLAPSPAAATIRAELERELLRLAEGEVERDLARPGHRRGRRADCGRSRRADRPLHLASGSSAAHRHRSHLRLPGRHRHRHRGLSARSRGAARDRDGHARPRAACLSRPST
jgi:hypothetical protein